jgi:hypothetical protein
MKITRQKPKRHHTYRKIFLPNEHQSCEDISDHRRKERVVPFCSVNSPQSDVSTTISFWGWQHKKGKKSKSVQVYSISTTNEESFFYLKYLFPRE